MTTGSEMVSPMTHYVNAAGRGDGGDATMSSVIGDLIPGNSNEWVNQADLLAANNVAATHK